MIGALEVCKKYFGNEHDATDVIYLFLDQSPLEAQECFSMQQITKHQCKCKKNIITRDITNTLFITSNNLSPLIE